MALTVRQNLKLDVPGVHHKFFKIHGPVAKASHRLRAGLMERGGQLLRGLHPADTPSAASGAGLQQHGIAHLRRDLQRGVRIGHRTVGPGNGGNSRRFHQRAGGSLASRLADGGAGGPDKLQSGFRAGIGKVGVL
ncbi:hypothetical protein SDC9_142715 [bioreactor metagenome]|uniref:Uncharacterized protein n=1 Tax=bioreactor metagenome TaxID=1076179 RepID=A0A645E1C0_9ZZZZ